MKLTKSSIVLASLAISGTTTLAAPTPPLPFDSPVPGSPKPDEWTEAARSPRIPRSPFLNGAPTTGSPRHRASIKLAGRRRSMPRIKRQDATPADPSADPAATPDETGLLGTVGDAVSDLLHTVGGIVHGLPIVGGLGILSEPDDGAAQSANADDNLPSPSALQSRQLFEPPVEAPVSPSMVSPPTPPISPEQVLAIRQAVLELVQRQQQAAAALQAAQGSMPAQLLEERLQALAALRQANGMNAQASPPNPSSLLGGIPLAGPVLSNILGGAGSLPPTGLLSGLLSPVTGTVGSLTGNLTPLLGNVLGSTPLGGLLQQTPLGSLLGQNPANGLLNILAGVPEGVAPTTPSGVNPPFGASPTLPTQNGVTPPQPGVSQLPNPMSNPSAQTGMPPAVPPNSPVDIAELFPFGAFADVPAPAETPDVSPPVSKPDVSPPQPSAPTPSSVPMDHDAPTPPSPPVEPSPPSAPNPAENAPQPPSPPSPPANAPTPPSPPIVGQMRRRSDSTAGESHGDRNAEDETDGFIPTAPDGIRPPLLARMRTFSSKWP